MPIWRGDTGAPRLLYWRQTALVERIAIVSGPGAGKTTLARALGLPHVELDALWWDSGWRQAPLDVLRVREVIDRDAWVVDGFYVIEAGVPIVWPRADTLVWLDLPRKQCVPRAVHRSLGQVARCVELWNGNRQRASVLTRAQSGACGAGGRPIPRRSSWHWRHTTGRTSMSCASAATTMSDVSSLSGQGVKARLPDRHRSRLITSSADPETSAQRHAPRTQTIRTSSLVPTDPGSRTQAYQRVHCGLSS